MVIIWRFTFRKRFKFQVHCCPFPLANRTRGAYGAHAAAGPVAIRAWLAGRVVGAFRNPKRP